MRKDLENSELYEERYRFQEKRSNRRFLVTLVAIVLLFWAFRIYWGNTFGGVEVDGASMNFTLYDKEQLIVRYVRNGEGVERGDVIVVHVENYPEIREYNEGKKEADKLKYLIKRLIAVEGDTVKCVDGQIYIKYAGGTDFVELYEPYAHYHNRATYDFDEYAVGKGEIFFLGDNRQNSMDSRYDEQGGSHLSDRLYLAKDIFGVVPQWAIDNQKILEKIFF